MRTAPLVLLAMLLHAPALAEAAGAPAGGAEKGRPTDLPRADARTLREADQALVRAVEQRDRAAFGALLTDDVYFTGRAGPLRSRAAVVDAWRRLFEPDGPRMSWEPELAEMSRSGDLGYTVGRYSLEVPGASGNGAKSEGRYLTVWRREPDGAFRAVVDSPLLPPADDEPTDAPRTLERKLSSRDGDLVVEAGTWRAKEGPARGGSYVTIRRRTREGTLATALETIVTAAAPAAD